MEKYLLFFLATIILLSGVLPVFAEVTEMQLDKNSYQKGDSINVRGTVSEDSSGLVTIVLRDPTDKFVLLSQAIIHSDDSFDKNIPINEKFQVPGTYNATSFVLNMTAGKTQSFDFDTTLSDKTRDNNENLYSDIEKMESEIIQEIDNKITEEPPLIDSELEFLLEDTENQIDEERVIEKQENEISKKSQIADFVDPSKKPEYYLDRYYNEPNYQVWFDKNYPQLSIEEAVGYITPTKSEIETFQNIEEPKIIPEAEALSTLPLPPNSENSDVAQVVLALGGLAILFGAVYGIKKKVDVNSKHISLNKDIIRRKIISPIIDSNPIAIIETRLAKGEISIEEYEKLKLKLDKNPR
jgi:hypothetical protein